MMSEENKMELECPDGVKRMFRTSGQDYSQKCGGWEDPETGVVYAIANWGSDRYWKSSAYFTFTLVSDTGASEEGRPVGERHKVEQFTHGYNEQMTWWFNENDIDVNALRAITFIWRGRVGPSYNLAAGPQKGKHVSESLPAIIPREMMYGIDSSDVTNHGLIGTLNNSTPVVEEVELPLVNYSLKDTNVVIPPESLGDLLSGGV